MLTYPEILQKSCLKVGGQTLEKRIKHVKDEKTKNPKVKPLFTKSKSSHFDTPFLNVYLTKTVHV